LQVTKQIKKAPKVLFFCGSIIFLGVLIKDVYKLKVHE